MIIRDMARLLPLSFMSLLPSCQAASITAIEFSYAPETHPARTPRQLDGDHELQVISE